MELEALGDLYLERRGQREPALRRFWSGESRYLVVQRPAYHLWGECNSVERVWQNNVRHMESWLCMPWSDELPHLQPWFGTGVYANAFGCRCLWREGEAPDCWVRFHAIEEVRGISKPDPRSSPVMGMVLECIDVLLERTRGRFPISFTDTQSPFDTATLVLDTSEFFTACYTDPPAVHQLMSAATELIIEFSLEQARRIGPALLSRPGHVMPSLPGLDGITLSDDNLAVSSPTVNEQFSLHYNQAIARSLGGVAIHCCGRWDHTMRLLPGRGVRAVDCSVSRSWDPTPMAPEAVRDALRGTGIAVKARCGGTPEEIRLAAAALGGRDMRVILDIARVEEDDAAYLRAAERNYHLAHELLERKYAG
ncbi:MAG TPA: uroporphyrinogen decarboxylase family protein [Spirochaetia bacterium]|nr:uroporphyrinogen decarboxylase family protein [Spirochaetia bacterium]